MSRRLIIRPDAYEDLAAAHDWYEAKQPGLGLEMSIAVLAKMQEAKVRPTSFPIRQNPDIRRVLVDRFPYVVYFRLRTDAVIVLAVFHTSQDHGPRLGKRL